MLGLANYNVDIMSVILERKKFWSHTIRKENPDWSDHLMEFLSTPDYGQRIRLIMVGDVFFLNRLKTESESLHAKNPNMKAHLKDCIILVFDTAENLSMFQGIHIADSAREGDSWRHHKINKLTELLEAAERGLVVVPVDARETKKIATPQPVTEGAPSVVFEPGKSLFFQLVENCLAPCAEEHQRQILRQLIAAWFEGGLSDDYGSRIVKRIGKYGGDVTSYSSLSSQAEETGYTVKLKKAAKEAAVGKDVALKDVSQHNNVRLGDLKWLNQNWPFSNLLSQDDQKEL